MFVIKIPLNSLQFSLQARTIVDGKVKDIAESIKLLGLLQPILVESIVGRTDIYRIVCGHHRVAACRKIGLTEIDAVVVDSDVLTNELIEIDENLCRAELTTAQIRAFTKRREQIWIALRLTVKTDTVSDLTDKSNTTPVSGLDDAKSVGGASCATNDLRSDGRRKGPQHKEGFAAATAAATGQSKATTNRALANANALGIDTLNKLANTSLDSGVELDALAKLPPEQRTGLVERAAAGERVSARLVAAPDAHGDELMQAMKFKTDFARITKEIDADNPRLAADLPWADVIRHMGWLLQDIQKRKRWPAIHPKTKTEIGLIWAELEAFFLTHLKG